MRPGWAIDDPQYDYGAPVSALTVNDNTLAVTVRPGEREGDPAAIELNPALEYYTIGNRVQTVAAGGERRLHSQRAAGTYQLELWGTIPLGDHGEELDAGDRGPGAICGAGAAAGA